MLAKLVPIVVLRYHVYLELTKVLHVLDNACYVVGFCSAKTTQLEETHCDCVCDVEYNMYTKSVEK